MDVTSGSLAAPSEQARTLAEPTDVPKAAEPEPDEPLAKKQRQDDAQALREGRSKAEAAAAAASEERFPHLCCGVCLSFPEGGVLQCSSGHIMCTECHARVCAEDKPTCPTCRIGLDPLKPIRNMLAEQTLALLPVACPNSPCPIQCMRGTVAQHLAGECAYRKVDCKYAPLGCKWSGLFHQCRRHEDRCKRAEQPGWKLLKKVERVQAAQRTAAEQGNASAETNHRIVAMLSSRCRNLEMSHIALHRCSAHEHIAGRPAHLASAAFHSIGWRFKLFTVHDPSNATYQVALQLRDSRTPLPVDFFVLGGPPSDARIQPATHSHTFGRRAARTSDTLTIAMGEAASTLSDVDALVLRIGMADRRTGRLSRDFQGQNFAAPSHPDEDEFHDADGVERLISDDDDDVDSISGGSSFDDEASFVEAHGRYEPREMVYRSGRY